MKKEWYSFQDFHQLVGRLNPFLWKDCDGNLMVFADYVVVYEYTMTAFIREFPRGYVDLVVFLYHMTQLASTTCSHFVAVLNAMGLEDTFLMKVTHHDDATEQKFRQILTAFHELTGTAFSENSFREAWSRMTPVT